MLDTIHMYIQMYGGLFKNHTRFVVCKKQQLKRVIECKTNTRALLDKL